MKLENQVVNLELAKKLKELGVEQESLFYWVIEYEQISGNEYVSKDMAIDSGNPEREGMLHCEEEWAEFPIITRKGEYYNWEVKDKYSAFTVAELGEMLPNMNVLSWKQNIGQRWICREDCKTDDHCEYADTEVDARAKILIYLIENKLLSRLK